MKRKEAYMILGVLEAAYPKFYNGKSEAEKMVIGDLWYGMFTDESGERVLSALKAFIKSDTSGFPPTIGQINSMMQVKLAGEEYSETEAWAIVRKAIKNSGYESEKEFSKLPKVIKLAVGNPANLFEWSQMQINEVESVVASNFMRSYRAKLKSQEFESCIPDDVKKLFRDSAKEIGDGSDRNAQVSVL